MLVGTADLKEIGKRIRAKRIANEMSQEDLAYAANTSASNISDIEHGKNNFRIDTFVRILEALQVSADYILRADVPNVNELYGNELSEILKGCSPSEVESILNLVREIKATFRSQKY